MDTEPEAPLPRWKWAIDRLLSPLAALVYGPRSEGEQPPGLAPKFIALAIVLLMAALAWVATHWRPEHG